MPDNTRAHTSLCREIQSYILGLGGYIVKNLGGLGQRPGRPDFDACISGKAVFIEAKTGKAELDANQVKERNRIELAGGIFIEARSIADVENRLVAAGLALPPLF